MSSSLSSRLQSIFSEREEGFINSLQSILESVSSDQYIQQMFINKLSANYIPDRVCELIRLFLQNDQEKYIEKLIKKIKSLEYCFGKEKFKKLEEIGNKMMEMSLTQAQKEKEYRKVIQLLTENQANENEEYSYNESVVGSKADLSNLKEIVSSFSNSTKNIYGIVKSFNTSIQKDFKKIRSHTRNYIGKINFSNDNLSKIKSDNSKLKQMVESLQEKKDQLQNSNKLLKMEVKSKQNTIDKYKNGRAKETQEFQKYLTKLNDQNKQILSENENLQNQLNQAKKQLSSYLADNSEKIENVQKEKQQILSQNSNLQDSLMQLQEKLRKKEEELDQHKEKIISVQNENEKLEARHSKLKNGVSQFQEQFDQKESEIKKLQSRIKALEDKNSQLEDSLRKSDNDSLLNQDQLEFKEREISDLQGQYQRLQSTINRLQEQNKKKDAEILEKQQAIESFENENNEQTDLNTQLQDNILQTKEKLRQKEKEIINLKRAIDEQQREILRETTQNSLLQNEKEDAIKRGNNLEKQNHELKGKINELQLAVREARQQLNHIQELARAEPNKEDLSRQLQTYMNENSELKLKNAHLQNQMNSYKEEAESLKNSFEKTSSQYKEKERSMKQMKEKYNYSQQKYNESKMKIEEINEKCSEYESSLKILAKKYQQKEKQINLHKKDKDDLRRKLQYSEEENQKLNNSLSNVNDQLYSLKQEMVQKDETISRLKESSNNQMITQRELANIQRTLNEKSSLLDNSENRNSSLMREIEEKEAKICQLSDSILDKDKELKIAQQNQMSIKRQNETLSALTQEQQRKLEEAHQEALSLHEELIKVQNESLTQSESIKAISIDQNREVEGRKQIQQLINQDREKYRNRISQLQEENSSLSVAKVDLQHKYDQLSFENKTLSQLLEAKESELSFEKERGSQDMQSASNVTNKILDENKSLKQELSEKNQYDKDLLNQIRDYYNSIQTLDEIPELIKQMVQMKDEIQTICDILKISKPYGIQSEINKLVEDNEKLSNRDEQIYSLFPDNNRDELPSIISDMKREFNELQSLKNKLQQITNSNNLLKSVQSNASSLKTFQKRELELTRIIPDYSFDKLAPEVSQLLHENQDNSKVIQYISSILGNEVPSNLPDAISDMKRKLENYQNAENQIKQIASINNISDIIPHLQKLMKQNDQFSNELKKINSVIPNDSDGSDLSQKISSMIQENLANKDILKSIIKSLPDNLNINKSRLINSLDDNKYRSPRKLSSKKYKNDSDSDNESNFGDNELVDIIARIARENEELKIQQKNIVESQLNNVNKKNKELMRERAQIAASLNCSESDDIVQKAKEMQKMKDELQKTLKSIASTLPSSNNDIQDTLQNLIQKNSEQERVLDKLNDMFSDDDGDDLVLKISQAMKDKGKIENTLNEIDSLLPSDESLKLKTKSSFSLSPKGKSQPDAIVSKLKNELSKEEEMDKLLKHLIEIIPKCTSTKDIVPCIESLINTELIIDSLVNSVGNSSGKNRKGKVNASKEIDEEELREKLKQILDAFNSIQSMIPDASSYSDLQEKLNDILNEKQTHKDLIEQASSILPPVDSKNKTKSKNKKGGNNENSLIRQAENAVEEIETMKGLINEIESTLPSSKTKNDILSRLKEELDDKEKVQKQLEILHSLFPDSNDFNELPQLLQNTLKENSSLKNCLSEAHQLLSPGENEPRKSSHKKKKSANDEIEPDQLLAELVQFKKESEDMKNQLLELDSLLSKYEEQQNGSNKPKSFSKPNKSEKSKADDSLSNRIQFLLDDKQQNLDDLDKITKQLFGESASYQPGIGKSKTNYNDENTRNINDIQSRIETLQNEREHLRELFTKELEKEEDNSYQTKPNKKQKQLRSKSSSKLNYINQENDDNIVEMANEIISAKGTLQTQLNEILSMFPDSKSPEELNSLISSLQEANNLSKDEQAELSLILQEEGEEGLADTVQKILKEKKQLEALVNEIESLLPPEQSNKNIKKVKSKQNKEFSLLSRIKNELDEKKDLSDKLNALQNQLALISGNECTSFDDMTNSLSDIQDRNSEMKNTIQSIGTIFSTKTSDDNENQNKKFNKNKNQNKPKRKNSALVDSQNDGDIDQEQLVQKVDNYVDASENTRKMLSEIESLLPQSKSNDDLFTQIKKELNKKNEVQQLTGNLQSMFPGVKTPDELATKIEELIHDNESLKKEMDSLNDILSKSQENEKRKINGQHSLIDNLLPQKQMDEIRKKENININDDSDEEDETVASKARLVVDQNVIYQEFADSVASLVPSAEQNNQKKIKKSKSKNSDLNNDEDVLTRLKNELKTKEKITEQLDNLCSMLSISSNDPLSSLFTDSLSSKLSEMLDENEQFKKKINSINSIIPRDENDNNEEDEDEKNDDLIPRCKSLVQQKEKQDSILDEINSLLQKSAQSESKNKSAKGKAKNKSQKKKQDADDGREDIVQKLKNELNEKDQLIQLLDSLKSCMAENEDENQLIDHFKTVLDKNNEFNKLLKEISELLDINESNNSNDDEINEKLIVSKINDLVNERDELKKSVDEIQSLLPKTKTKDSLVSRIQKELKKKDDSIKQLETMQNLLPSIKSPNDILGQMQTILNESNDLKGVIIEMIKLLPSEKENIEDDNDDEDEDEEDLLSKKDDLVPRMKEILKERKDLKQQMDQLIPLLSTPSSKSNSASPIDLIKNEIKNGKNAQKKLNDLLDVIPDLNDPENVVDSVEKLVKDNEKMKQDLKSLEKVIPPLESIEKDSSKLKDNIPLINQTKDDKNDEFEEEEEDIDEDNEKSDLLKRAQMVVSLGNAMKNSINEFDTLLPNSQMLEKAASQPLPKKSKTKSPNSQQNKKENNLIVDRLKNTLDDKMKIEDQLEKINQLMEISGSNDLTNSLQGILQDNSKFKSLFKDSFEIIKQNLEKPEEEDENEEEDSEDNFNSNKYLGCLKNLMKDLEEMKKEMQSIDDLTTQQEQQEEQANKPKSKSKQSSKLTKQNSKSPSKPEKNQEVLSKRVEKQYEKHNLNKENLESIIRQLFGDDSSEDKVKDFEGVISQLKSIQEERQILIELFQKEAQKEHDEDQFIEEEEEDKDESNTLLDLANEIISLLKKKNQLLSEIDSIVPTQFEEEKDKKKKPKSKSKPNKDQDDVGEKLDLVSRVQKLNSEYEKMKSDLNKIESLFQEKENDEDDLPTRIESVINLNDDLSQQINELHSLFPKSNSQEEFKLSVTGLLKDAESLTQFKAEIDNLLSEQFPEVEPDDKAEISPFKLKLLLKEKEDICTLLGVKDNAKSAVEILIDQKADLKKEYDELYDHLSQLRVMLNCNSNEELNQKVAEQKSALKSMSDLFVKLIEILIGPTTIQLPISTQMRDKLFSILTEMKKRIHDTDEKIVLILNEAKRDGYNGKDLYEAVKFLKETAVIYEQQRINEEYHGQVSSIQTLMSEQGKTYDDIKKRYKTANETQQAKLNEIQEQYQLRENEIIAENEEIKKKLLSLQDDLEMTNKAKIELLRLACGQSSDKDLLKNNLDRNEYLSLLNAEKIIKKAFQNEEKSNVDQE